MTQKRRGDFAVERGDRLFQEEKKEGRAEGVLPPVKSLLKNVTREDAWPTVNRLAA